jgi:hypothetical protein
LSRRVTAYLKFKEMGMALQQGYERKNRLNLPFDFEEAVLSPKEQMRLQNNPFTPNPFLANTSVLMVEEFQVCELSARLRTINNARDSMAVLPDGTPLTEVTMYGRRGAVYLLGPLQAIKSVMSGEPPPSNKKILQRLESARGDIKKSLTELTQGLNGLYANKTATLILVEEAKVEIRFGHGAIVEASMKALSDLLSDLQLLEDMINAWAKWWAPQSDQADSISNRIAATLVMHDKVKVHLVEMLKTEIQHPTKGNSHILQGIFCLIDELKYSFNVISKEVLDLQQWIDQLSKVKRIQNITIAGTLTQLWHSDLPHIETALQSLRVITSELLELELDVVALLTADNQSDDQLEFFLNRKSDFMSRFNGVMSNLVKQVAGQI